MQVGHSAIADAQLETVTTAAAAAMLTPLVITFCLTLSFP